MNRIRTAAIIGTILMAIVAFWGYRLSQSWGSLGEILARVNTAEPAAPPSVTLNSSEVPRSAPAVVKPADIDAHTPAADSQSPPDLRQEVFELRQEIARVLINDQELLASLNELFEEPDEDLLRENLEILREAFLSDTNYAE